MAHQPVFIEDLDKKQALRLHSILANPFKEVFNLQQVLMVLHGFGYEIDLIFTKHHEPNFRIKENGAIHGEYNAASLIQLFCGGNAFRRVGLPKRVQEMIGYL